MINTPTGITKPMPSSSVVLKGRRYIGCLTPEYDRPELLALFDDVEALIALPKSKCLKTDPTSTVVRVRLDVDGATREIVVKRWNKPGLRRIWRSRGRPQRNWFGSHRLLQLGIHTARPVAMFERRRLRSIAPSYFISEWVSGTNPLNVVAQQSFHDQRARRQIFAAIGRTIASLLRQGVYHDDLKATNILVGKFGAEIRIYLIDLDGIEFHPVLPDDLQLSAIARLVAALRALPAVRPSDLSLLVHECTLPSLPHSDAPDRVWALVHERWPDQDVCI